MRFEVDNTTDRIVEKITDSVESSIRNIHDDQASILKGINSLKDDLSQEELEESIRKVNKSVDGLSDRMESIERQNDDSLAIIEKIKSQVEILGKTINYGDEFDELKKSIAKLSSVYGNIEKIFDEIKGEQNSISVELEKLNIQVAESGERIENLEKNIIEKVTNVSEREESIIEAVNELINQANVNNENISSIEESQRKHLEEAGKIKTLIEDNNKEIKKELEDSIVKNKDSIKDAETVVIGKIIDTQKIIDEDRKENNEKLSNINSMLEEGRGNILQAVSDLQQLDDRNTQQIVSMLTENAERDVQEKEKIDRITEYLKKPGIVRFFSGMKGE